MFKLIYMLVVASTGMPFGTVTMQAPMDRDACITISQDVEQATHIAAFVKEETGVDVEALPVCHPVELPGRPT